MGLLDGVTPAQVVEAIEGIAHDVSIFAPPPFGTVASLLADGAGLIDTVLRAKDAGATEAALVAAIEGAMKLASDAQMQAELKP